MVTKEYLNDFSSPGRGGDASNINGGGAGGGGVLVDGVGPVGEGPEHGEGYGGGGGFTGDTSSISGDSPGYEGVIILDLI